MKVSKTRYIVFSLIISLLFSICSSNNANAEVPSIKMFLCANNPLSDMYDKPGITPGKIMNNCKERLDGYSWGSRIYTLIYAPGFNTDPHAIDVIGNNPDTPIFARSKDGYMSLKGEGCNGFVETGRDHGLFYGSIKLSGFKYDITGDGRPDNFGGNRCESTYSTLDDGSGRVEARQFGGVTISFQYDDDHYISKTAKYSWRESTLSFDKEQYAIGDTAVLTLNDLDNVRFPFDDKFGFPIRVYSDTDTAGLDLLVYWVANYKGIVQMNGNYPADIELIDNGESKGSSAPFNNTRGQLRISAGDTIYAEYDDWTLPKPSRIGDYKKITTIAKVVNNKQDSDDFFEKGLEGKKTDTSTDTKIPEWVKNSAKWWSDGQVDDKTFANGIQYLLDEKIITIPVSKKTQNQQDMKIPEWVKNSAKWWSDGQVDDKTFANCIQYLINCGMLSIWHSKIN